MADVPHFSGAMCAPIVRHSLANPVRVETPLEIG